MSSKPRPEAAQQPPQPQPKKEAKPAPVITDYASI